MHPKYKKSSIFYLTSVFLVASAFLFVSAYAESANPIAYFPPPLKQIEQGTDPVNVTCTEGKELVLKKSNGLPACVFPSSVEKLIEREWAIHVLPDYSDKNNNSQIFDVGQYSVTTETVAYFENTNGYLAKPSATGSFPGIVMIHEWWGLNENIKEMAEKLASHGYVVLAVDLYDGSIAKTSEQARNLIQSFDQKRGIDNMNAAVTFLKQTHDVDQLGSIGWCFGGGQSLNLAINNDQMDATVIYYGSVSVQEDKLQTIDWPVLGIFAELDNGIPVKTVNEFENTLNSLGIENQIYIYPDVDHAFANPSGDRYAPNAAEDAWDKTLMFLKNNLE